MAKPIRALELHYPQIQFLIKINEIVKLIVCDLSLTLQPGVKWLQVQHHIS